MYLPSLHLIGLSLGAQMAGVCGANVKSGRVFRITGLDPAGPLFKKWPKHLRLDSSDAEFVDAIHTDAGIFGFPRNVGHVDFWPNKGISPQPGCTKIEVKRTTPDNTLALSRYWFLWLAKTLIWVCCSFLQPLEGVSVLCRECGESARVRVCAV